MDPKTFIESGVIERYALGQATCFEAREVEFMAEEHPGVRKALEDALVGVEALGRASAVPLSTASRSRSLAAVLERIDGTQEAGSPVHSIAPRSKADAPSQRAGSDASGKGATQVRRLQTWTGIAAALVLLAGAAALYLSNQNRSLLRQQAIAQTELDRLDREADAAKAELDRTRDDMALLRDAATQRIALMPVGADQSARVDVYYNPESQQAYFDVLALSELPSDRQYQLWAIVNGVPQDMGVLPVSADAAFGEDLDGAIPDLQAFPFVEAPQAFAITIEPLGGSKVPTLDQMVVMGALG